MKFVWAWLMPPEQVIAEIEGSSVVHETLAGLPVLSTEILPITGGVGSDASFTLTKLEKADPPEPLKDCTR